MFHLFFEICIIIIVFVEIDLVSMVESKGGGGEI